MATEKDRVPLSSEASQARMPAGAVFLSYASEDAAAAERIASTLRDAGIEVWFDKSELRGGDAWDRQIRTQIHECRLFMPIVSANTEARVEGYFRREWKLAVDRTHDLSERVAFLVPVVIDATPEAKADVPDAFRHVQWTRFPGGEMPPTFVQRVQKLLVPDAPTRAAAPAPSRPTAARPSKSRVHPTWPSNAVLGGISALLVIGLAYLIAVRLWPPQHSQAPVASQKTASSTSATPSTVDAFNPPPHSVAVLPFVNMSGDKEQEYFSEGLTEELLNSLSRINELQVAARTSSFSFQGEHPDISTVAHKLNVGAVLEGSVRRSAHTIRVTTQLVNGVTGFHLWSETYDRSLGDVLKLQSEIATAVASALRVTLLGDESAKIELGGTHIPGAFDAYLRGSKASSTAHDTADLQSAVEAYSEAVRLDAHFALAFAGRAEALYRDADEWLIGAAARKRYESVVADARQAIALAPELAEGHLALGSALEDGFFDFANAATEFARAMELSPGSARVLQAYGSFAVDIGRTEPGLAAIRRAIVLDPLNTHIHAKLGEAYWAARRYDQALVAFNDVIVLDPQWMRARAWRGFAYYGLGDYERARSSCEELLNIDAVSNAWNRLCLAWVYHKLGRHADAEAMLAKQRALVGDVSAYHFAGIYAQWGDAPRAREWLATAVRVRDPALAWLKTDPFLDPVRTEPWFQAIERALKFPD